MATKLDISQLDFDGIKDNLKTFLTQQDEFTESRVSLCIDKCNEKK